jgi:hypothetical protein
LRSAVRPCLAFVTALTRVTIRPFLVCVASATEWERAGIVGTTVTAMLVKGLIERKRRWRARFSQSKGARWLAALLNIGRYYGLPVTTQTNRG